MEDIAQTHFPVLFAALWELELKKEKDREKEREKEREKDRDRKKEHISKRGRFYVVSSEHEKHEKPTSYHTGRFHVTSKPKKPKKELGKETYEQHGRFKIVHHVPERHGRFEVSVSDDSDFEDE